MSELSFLLELLLNHKLAKPTKEAITNRVKEVEANLSYKPVQTVAPIGGKVPDTRTKLVGGVQQSASMAAQIAEMEAEYGVVPVSVEPAQHNVQNDPQPVAVIAQTPAAMAALQARNTAIAIAHSGKEEKGRTSPRKF